MKSFIYACVFTFLHSLADGQNPKKLEFEKTKIFLIGVIHSENQLRNTDSLLNILKIIKPDLILYEGDSTKTYFPRQYKLSKPPWWFRFGRTLRFLRKTPPEIEVLFKYKKEDNKIKILPFDIEVKNKRKFAKLYLKSEKKWYSLIYNAFNRGEIPKSLTALNSTYLEYNYWLNKTFKKSYKDINNLMVTDSIRQYQNIEKEYIKKITDSTKLFNEFKMWDSLYNNFWFARGELMANKIIKMSEITKSKKVVVFTGLLHKYFLLDLLKKYNIQNNYQLIEYFE